MSSYAGWAPRNREHALELLQAGFAGLQYTVMTAAGWRADPYTPPTGPIWEWWTHVGIPVIDQWQRFQADQATSWSRFWTNWGTYDKWHIQLQQLLAAVIDHGIAIKALAVEARR